MTNKLLKVAGCVLLIIGASSCVQVKEYQKNRLNDAEMVLGNRKVEKNELNFESYREAASGATRVHGAILETSAASAAISRAAALCSASSNTSRPDCAACSARPASRPLCTGGRSVGYNDYIPPRTGPSRMTDFPCRRSTRLLTRRDLLVRSANGFGAAALATLFAEEELRAQNPGAHAPGSPGALPPTWHGQPRPHPAQSPGPPPDGFAPRQELALTTRTRHFLKGLAKYGIGFGLLAYVLV